MIRPAQTEDYPVIVEMGRHFYSHMAYHDIPYCGESALRWLDFMRQHGMLLVAEADGQVVGVAGGVISPCLLNDSFKLGAELLWWVEPDHRGTSAGRELLAGLERAAKDLGVHRWTMISLEAVNPEAVGRMYVKAGYTLTEHSYSKVL